jgi:hypothetical protein
MARLRTSATSSLVLISGWRLSGAIHLGQPWTPGLRLPPMRARLSALLMEGCCPFLPALQGSPYALRMHAQRLARFDASVHATARRQLHDVST